MNGHGHCSEQQRTAGKVGRPWPRGVSGNPGSRPNGLARATREWLARTEVTVGGRQADARSGNCLRMDAFCTATNCIGVHRSAASPCSQHAPRGRGVPKCHNNAGRIPGRRGTSARSSGIASDAWLLALSAARKKRQLSRHARGYTNAHASPPPTTRTTGRHRTTAAAAAT